MPVFKTTLSQDDLIKGCTLNDRRAQELLYKHYCQSMLAICISYSKTEADAVEILQDGFLKIFQQIQRYDSSKASLYTWKRTIMVRTAIDFLRRSKQAPHAIEWEEQHDPAIDADALQQMSAQEIIHLL